MTRNLIRLTESDLHKIIKEAVEILLEEYDGPFNVKQMFKSTAPFCFYKPGSGKEESTDIDFDDPDFNWKAVTGHFHDEVRRERINDILLALNYDIGQPAYSFVVNKGHANGDEVHTITTKAVVVAQNFETGLYTTLFAAGPGRIKKYWKGLNLPFPNDNMFRYVIKQAVRNMDKRIGQ